MPRSGTGRRRDLPVIAVDGSRDVADLAADLASRFRLEWPGTAARP